MNAKQTETPALDAANTSIEVRTAQMGLGQPVPPPEGRGLQAARDPHGNRGSPRRANRLGRGRGRVAGLTRLLLVLKNKYI